MKAYKVVYNKCSYKYSFNVLEQGYTSVSVEKFFGSKEKAEEFIKKINDAIATLDLTEFLGMANIEQVDLE